MGRRVFWNYYKGHMDKTKGEDGSKGGKWVWLGWGGGVVGRKCRQLLLNNNKVIKKEKEKGEGIEQYRLEFTKESWGCKVQQRGYSQLYMVPAGYSQYQGEPL